MTNPYVQSNYPRIAGDHYPTIDPRCVNGLLEHFELSGLIVDVCAPNGSGIVDHLAQRGRIAQCWPDAFSDMVRADWIVTNPPYKRGLVDKIIARQIERVARYEVKGVAVLLRSNFDFAKSRAALFDDPFYYGQVKLRFRPWWSEDRKAQPIHNYIWHIWRPHLLKPVVLYADGESK